MIILKNNIKFNFLLPNHGIVYRYLQKLHLRKLKEKVLSNGTFELYRLNRLAEYSRISSYSFCNSFNYELVEFLAVDFSTFDNFELKLCEKLYNSRRSKCGHLRKKIDYMFSFGNCVFLTLTWNDYYLSLSDRYRREIVKGVLSKFPLYVANIDFGQSDNYSHREHYHAIILSDYFDLSSWKYGYVFAERINVCDSKCLSKYLNKLSNHAFKLGASSTRLLCSQHFFDKKIKLKQMGIFDL